MKRIALLLISALVIFSCSDDKQIVLKGVLKNNLKGKKIYLYKFNGDQKDSIGVCDVKPNGDFKFKFKDENTFLYVLTDNKSSIYLMLSPKTKVNIEIDDANFATAYTSNSDECEKIRTFNTKVAEINKGNVIDTAAVRSFKSYVEKSVYASPYSMANIYAMFLKVGDYYIFDIAEDARLYKTVASALDAMYPNEPYVKWFYGEVKKQVAYERALKNQSKMNEMMKNAKVVDFPEIEMKDRFGKVQKLSSLKGKYILIDFWTSTSQECLDRNAELKSIYNKYRGSFEIYQVSLDVNKAAWEKALKFDDVNWISVCDFLGANSKVVANFNIQKIPSSFLLDKSGSKVLGKDMDLMDLAAKLHQLTGK